MTLKITKLIESILDIILPKPEKVKKLEVLSAKDFKETVGNFTNNPFGNRQAVVLFDYERKMVRLAIWELKYRGNKKIVRMLAECLYEKIVQRLQERGNLQKKEKPLLIPIPLSKKRLQERGFNQCELLTNHLKKMDNGQNFEIDNSLLRKIKNTPSQTKKNRKERLENLSGCFEVSKKEKIAKRTIFLLDDVMTTGATFEEAKKTLLGAGARKVILVAVAH